MSNAGMILTNAGKNLLALALTGQQLIFTRAFVGDGSLGSRNPASLINLISPKRELPIQSMNVTGSIGTCEVVLEMTNKNLQTGFFVREYGLFARLANSGQEILYAYCNKGDEAGYLEGDNGVDIIAYTLSIVTVIDQAPNVSAIINNTNQYVTISRMEQRVGDLFADYQDAKGFWAFEQTGEHRLRPATIEQTRRALWGNVDITGFDSRLERLEDAINQTSLILEMLQQYPGYSHYLAEDFSDTSSIDTFSAKITSIVAGDDSIDCEPLDGMLPGGFYTISDGINSETVQVESINLENGIQRVILKDVISNTYILANTKIFRTSAGIDNQTATGTTARYALAWEPSLIWQGTGANSSYSVNADITVNNSNKFNLTGSAVITSGGLVSLTE